MRFVHKIVFILFVEFSSLNANFTVAIDPGHSMKSFGAVSSSGIREYTYNITMAKVLLHELKNTKNIDAFIINPSGGQIKLKERTALAVKYHADIFLSIHHDSVQLKYLKSKIVRGQKLYSTYKFKGYSLFVSKKNTSFPKSFTLAMAIATQIKGKGFLPTLHHAEKIKGESRILLDKNAGVYQFDDLIVLKSSALPSVLIECGVIVNPDEEKAIQNKVYHKKMAIAIKEGIIQYMKEINPK